MRWPCIAGTGYGVWAEVTGASTTNIAGYFNATGATNNYPGIFMGGNVGIGTTTPNANLDIVSATNPSLRIGDGVGVGQLGYSTCAGCFSAYAVTGDLVLRNFSSPGVGNVVIDAETATGNIKFGTGSPAVQKMVILNNGNVGIGTTTPNHKLEVNGDAGFYTNSTRKEGIKIQTNYVSAQTSGRIFFNEDDVCCDNDYGFSLLYSADPNPTLGGIAFTLPNNTFFILSHTGSPTGLVTMAIQRASGNVGIGGITAPTTKLHVQAAGATVSTFDRTTNDGTIISLRQAGIQEGTISVAGATVSYNAFTGSHYAWTDQSIEKGMLVALTGDNQYMHNNKDSEIIYGVEISTRPNDPKIMGAFLALEESTLPYSVENPNLVMAVGNGVMWVIDKGENIMAGDYLISSDFIGHAMKDNGTYSTSFVIARVAEPVDWAVETSYIDGVKHKLVSVFFENYVRNNAEVELQKTKVEIDKLKTRIQNLELLMNSSDNVASENKGL